MNTLRLPLLLLGSAFALVVTASACDGSGSGPKIENASFTYGLYFEIAPRTSIDDAMGPEGLSGASPEWLGSTNLHTVYSTEVSP